MTEATIDGGSDAPTHDLDERGEVAFGSDKVQGRSCPVRRAGMPVEGGSLELAGEYDYILSEQEGRGEGTVSLETAREAWDKLIGKYEDDANNESLPEDSRQRAERLKELAEEIREEAFPQSES